MVKEGVGRKERENGEGGMGKEGVEKEEPIPLKMLLSYKFQFQDAP